MDLQRALRYPFSQSGWWKTLVLAAVAGAIPYFGSSLVLAHFLPVAAAVARGEATPAFPRWAGLGGFVGRVVRMAIYSVVFGVGLGLFVCGVLIATMIVEGLTSGAMTWGIGGLVLIGALPVLLVFVMVYQACTGRFAISETVGDALDVGLAWAMVRAQPVAWFLSAIVPLVVGIVASLPNLGLDAITDRLNVLYWGGTGIVSAVVVPIELHLIGQAHRRSAPVIERRQIRAVETWETARYR